MLSGQFDGPVGVVEELLPASVAFVIEVDVDMRVAFGLYWFLDEFHVCLLGGAAAFFDIAACAGADDVVPGAFAAEATRGRYGRATVPTMGNRLPQYWQWLPSRAKMLRRLNLTVWSGRRS